MMTVGQLRHLEVARAIATRADLLLADEPCAGLNPTETAAMIDVLRRIRASGVTVVLVEHDMPSVMEVSDRVLVLERRPPDRRRHARRSLERPPGDRGVSRNAGLTMKRRAFIALASVAAPVRR